jgi:hypothetical protein
MPLSWMSMVYQLFGGLGIIIIMDGVLDLNIRAWVFGFVRYLFIVRNYEL